MKLSPNIITEIADYIIKNGTSQTTSGNAIFYYDELADKFGVNVRKIISGAEDIVNELCKHEEFCWDDQVIMGDCFDVMFYTNYCPNCYDYYEDPNFIDDDEKMRDFVALEKSEFLQSYSYLTEREWDNTAKIYYKLKSKYCCPNCGIEFLLEKIYKDELGVYTVCPDCSGSFDIG